MKLQDLPINDYFETNSGIKWKKLPMTAREKKLLPDRFKCQNVNTKNIYFLTEMFIILIR